MKVPTEEEEAIVWDYYKPRHTHSWNMLVLSWRELEFLSVEDDVGFDAEYAWENFIIRLWLYRTTSKTLTKLQCVANKAKEMLADFDKVFESNGVNSLKALRDMIEHFDDYAAGQGRGAATRRGELDPWRQVTKDSYERGKFSLDRAQSYEAAIKLRTAAKKVSDEFIRQYNSKERPPKT